MSDNAAVPEEGLTVPAPSDAALLQVLYDNERAKVQRLEVQVARLMLQVEAVGTQLVEALQTDVAEDEAEEDTE